MDYTAIDMELEMKTVCRICLQKTEDGFDIFSERKESRDVLEKIYLCFQIILSHEKYLPCMICVSCLEELNMANNFRLKCASFEESLIICLKQIAANKQINRTLQPQAKPLNYELISEAEFDESQDSEIVTVNSETDVAIPQDDVKRAATLECDICHKILKSRNSLSKHNISMHQKRKHIGKVTGFGANRRYHCTYCAYSTPHSQTLVNHIRRHEGERPYQCYCGKTFTQSSSLVTHQKTHSDITYFTCSMCGKQFKHAFTLKNHLRVHETGRFVCKICQKVLKSKQSLQDHMRRHYNVRNYNCEECGDTFVTSSELLNHRKKHTLQKRIECHLCAYKTHTKKNLILHLKRYV